MVKVHEHHHKALSQALAAFTTTENVNNAANGVQMGSGIKGASTITLGDHAVTASNWEYILISVVLFLILVGGIGLCVWKSKKGKDDHDDNINEKE